MKIVTGSYFQVLGLDIAADSEAVEKAYHEVAIRFHPDTYAEWDLSEIADVLVGTIRTWVQREQSAATEYRRIEVTAALWARGREGLLRRPYLDVATTWLEQQKPSAAWAARYRPLRKAHRPAPSSPGRRDSRAPWCG